MVHRIISGIWPESLYQATVNGLTTMNKEKEDFPVFFSFFIVFLRLCRLVGGVFLFSLRRNIIKMKRYFMFDELGTDYKREIIGGVTTFLAMAYILFVNPSILSLESIPDLPEGVGMDKGAVFTA